MIGFYDLNEGYYFCIDDKGNKIGPYFELCGVVTVDSLSSVDSTKYLLYICLEDFEKEKRGNTMIVCTAKSRDKMPFGPYRNKNILRFEKVKEIYEIISNVPVAGSPYGTRRFHHIRKEAERIAGEIGGKVIIINPLLDVVGCPKSWGPLR